MWREDWKMKVEERCRKKKLKRRREDTERRMSSSGFYGIFLSNEAVN